MLALSLETRLVGALLLSCLLSLVVIRTVTFTTTTPTPSRPQTRTLTQNSPPLQSILRHTLPPANSPLDEIYTPQQRKSTVDAEEAPAQAPPAAPFDFIQHWYHLPPGEEEPFRSVWVDDHSASADFLSSQQRSVLLVAAIDAPAAASWFFSVQSLTVCRFAPFVAFTLPLHQLLSSQPPSTCFSCKSQTHTTVCPQLKQGQWWWSHALYVAPQVLLASPVDVRDFFTRAGEPILRVTLMSKATAQLVRREANHPRFRRNHPIAGTIQRWAGAAEGEHEEVFFHDARQYGHEGRGGFGNASWQWPPFLHAEVVPLVPEMLQQRSSLWDLRLLSTALRVRLAQEYFVWRPRTRFLQAFLRGFTCQLQLQRANLNLTQAVQYVAGRELYYPVWLRGCVPQAGAWYDRYFAVPPHFLHVRVGIEAEEVDASQLQESLQALASGFVRPPLPPPRRTPLRSLLVVAHPDDETLFVGEALLRVAPWHVVVVTHDSLWRWGELHRVCATLHVSCETLGFPSWSKEGLIRPGLLRGLEQPLDKILRSQPWNMIVTHDDVGLTDHIQHSEVFHVVVALWTQLHCATSNSNVSPASPPPPPPPPLYVFGHEPYANLTLAVAHLQLLSAYPSQMATVEKHCHYWVGKGGLRPVPLAANTTTCRPKE